MKIQRTIAMVLALTISAATAASAHTPPAGVVQDTSYLFPVGVTPDGALPCTVVCSYWIDNGFTPCENPFPPGSYLERVTAPAPAAPTGKVAVLEVTLDVEIDWDMFLCTSPGRIELPGDDILGEPCDNLLGENNVVPIGCHENASAPVASGRQILIVVYNWSDVFDAHGRSWISFI